MGFVMRYITAVLSLSLSIAGAAFGVQAGKEIVQVGPALNYPFSQAVKAGGFIYVSGTMATDESGRLVPGDIKAQTARALENISAVLKAAGSNLQNAVSVTVYLKNASDFGGMNEVYRGHWLADPPARTTIAANLVNPEGLVEISMVAVPGGAERRVIRPQGWVAGSLPFSYGILAGDTLFLSGLVSKNGKDNAVVAGDIQVQTRTALDNAGEILKAAGMTHADAVGSRVFITDTALFQDMNSAYRTYFQKDPPARATVQAGLMGPEFQVEITLVAVKGGSKEAFTTPNADGSPGTPSPNFSSAVRVGNRLYVAGMVGSTEANRGDIRAQTREALSRIGRTLNAAGFDWTNVVDAIVYLTDVKNFGGMNEAYRETFTKGFPARATMETGIVAPDALIEIMFTAVK
jgi:2-iminobutanoate/2-iminopropanoate deaminase